MSFDLLTPLTRIATKLTTSPALVQEVRIGSPSSLGYQVTASLTLAAGTPNPEDFDTEGLQQDYLVEFAYDTGGDVDAAERAIIAAVPVFKDRIDHDVTLGGAVVRAHVHWQSASAPEYVAVAGSEVRRFPVIVSCQLEEPNPEVPAPPSGGTGEESMLVYSHTCDGVETELALPVPEDGTLRRTILVQMPDPAPTATLWLILGKDDGSSPNVRSSFDSGAAWNLELTIAFPASDHPAGYYHLVNDHGGGDAAGFNGGLGWWGSGGTPNGAIPEWTLRCSTLADASDPAPFPIGTLVAVLDTPGA